MFVLDAMECRSLFTRASEQSCLTFLALTVRVRSKEVSNYVYWFIYAITDAENFKYYVCKCFGRAMNSVDLLN